MAQATRVLGVLTAAALCLPLLPEAASEAHPPTTAHSATPIAKTVLIVRLEAGARTPQRATRALISQRPGIVVRRQLTQLDSFSVAVPVSDVRSTALALAAMPGVAGVERPVRRSYADAPNDPAYPRESSYLAAVGAPAAWTRQRGSAHVRIAVLDSGVDTSHPDLRHKIAATYNADKPGTPVTDSIGHGSFVAGVAAAQTDNGIGVAGAGYDTDLMAVKIAATDGSLPIDDEVAGIIWATDHGAQVINLSIAGPDPSSAERSAIAYAQQHGVLVVAAAGNEQTSAKQYPAAYPGVIAVGSTDIATGRRSSYSNYGAWVTVGAPGENIYSTTPLAGSEFYPSHSGYATDSGTSFATPLVAAEAALLKAQDPHATAAQLRHAVVASAAGYRGQGLGAGQVDFAAALDHLPPRTTPAAVTVAGRAGVLRLRAASSAPRVAFRLSGGPWLRSVAAHGGVAIATLPSFGYANGQHTVTAVDCSPHGECASSATTAQLSLANAAPGISRPSSDGRLTGRFPVRARDTGGGVRLLVDGRRAGFDARGPYDFEVNATTLRDGRHTLQVVACSADGQLCAGPRSTPLRVVTRALHFAIRKVRQRRFSPNHDGVHDVTRVLFHLGHRAKVGFDVTSPDGQVIRSAGLGTLGAGLRTITWHGVDQHRKRVPDGAYVIGVRTDSRGVKGYRQTTVDVDTVAPRLAHAISRSHVFYPVRDGYRDRFSASVVVASRGTLRLVVRAEDGRLVRSIARHVRAGRHTISWNGRGTGGPVATGMYTWRFVVTDAAGNSRSSRPHAIRVSGRRLVTRVVTVVRRGSSARGSGGTAGCASGRRASAPLAHGLRLRNACADDGYDLAYADYSFRLPKAAQYTRLELDVYGQSTHRPSELTSVIERADESVEVPGYLKVRAPGAAWHVLQKVHAAGHLIDRRHVYVSVYLDSVDRNVNDFEIGKVRLRVTLRVLG